MLEVRSSRVRDGCVEGGGGAYVNSHCYLGVERASVSTRVVGRGSTVGRPTRWKDCEQVLTCT